MNCLYPDKTARASYERGCRCFRCKSDNTERGQRYRRKKGMPLRTQVDTNGNLIESLWSITPTGCWEWSGNKNQHGYGRIMIHRTVWLAHRRMYYQVHGELPEVVMHQCDNPGCVNPEHLVGGTQLENIADMNQKRRHHYGTLLAGENHPRARLSWDQVKIIRRLVSEGNSQIELAKRYGVSKTAIYNVVHGISWR